MGLVRDGRVSLPPGRVACSKIAERSRMRRCESEVADAISDNLAGFQAHARVSKAVICSVSNQLLLFIIKGLDIIYK